MSMRKNSNRLIALLLTLVMLLSVLPMGVFAAEGVTVMGEPTVVDANGAIALAREVNFNKDWKFYLGNNESASNKNFDDSSWDDVDLPHDFSIIQEFTSSGEAESGFLPGGTGWYRKTFVMPMEAADQSVLLNFDGVYMHAYVYVNGTFVGEHHYGYTTFAIDITDYLICDGASENIVAVKAVNNLPSSRWYSGSGIYRDVSLVITNPVHVDLNGTCVTTPDIASGSGKVNVEVEVVNDGDTSVTATVKNTVYAKGSETAAATAESTVTVAAGAVAVATNAPVVSSPALWSLENPNLYIVKTEVIVGGEVVDTYETQFGFRWFTFSSTGFALNGENVKLDGVCMHHDQGAAGSAAYYDAMYRQLSIMKDMGCNAIRTSHNPVDEHYIQICEELGLLVIEEVYDGLVDVKNGNYNDFSSYFEAAVDTKLYGAASGMSNAEYAARSTVKRDRNSAAVFAWSFGNEIQEGTYWENTARFDEICADFISWVNDEDGTRIVTNGDNNKASDSRLADVDNVIINAGGVVGFNYANTASYLYSLLQSYGGSKGVIIASETASHTNSRGQYTSQSSNSSIDGKFHLTSYDTSAVSWGITAHDSIYNTYQYDGVAGEFVWTGFDYIGEPTPWNGTGTGDNGRGAIPNSSYFGIVETTGFPKDSYYLYRAQWHESATTLHLVTAWDSDNMMTTSGKTPVWVYSNAPVVKLYRDGVHIGTATRTAVTSPAGHVYYTYTTSTENSSICSVQSQSGADALYAIFNVTYTAGTLSAKAFEADGTTEIALTGDSGKNTVTTPGTVSKLAVSQNRTTAPADGSSLIYVEVDVTDANGNLDTTATNNITFTVSGPGEILGVDNGDQATVRKYQSSYVKTSDTTANINAYAGKALVIIRTTEDAGQITVNVASTGLTGGTAVVNTTEVESNDTTGLQTYTMVRDYSVHVGVNPTLDTAATGTLADGSTVTGTIVWDEVSEDVYGTAGDHTITGTLTFPELPPVQVTARLHVIPNVIAVRNISCATSVGVVPTLPNTVKGVMPDGTLVNEFEVQWDAVTAEDLATVDELVVVNGTATILGEETLPVTCTIRVAEEVASGSENIGPQTMTLTQDVPAGYQSDNLDSVINERTKVGDNTSERWTNWNYRTTSDNATITMVWATAHLTTGVDLYYYYDNCCAKPQSVEFSYSLNGNDYTVIAATEELVESYDLGAHYSYTFAQPVDPVGLQIKLTQQNGTSGSNCVGLTEIEVISTRFAIEVNSSANLSGITVDGTPVAGFTGNILNYLVVDGENVEAATDANVGITVLPAYNGVIRILTISEDGSAAKTYTVAVEEDALVRDDVNVTVKVGETETIIIENHNYADQFDDTGLNEDIATVEVVGTTISADKSLTEMTAAPLEDGTYILVNNRAGKPMTNDAATIAAGGGTANGRALSGSLNDMADNAVWTVTKVSDGVYTVQDASGKYLTIANNVGNLVDDAVELDIVYTDGYWTISEDEAYLNDAAEGGSCAAGWKGSGASTDAGSKWSIHKLTVTEEENSTTITIEGKAVGTTSFVIGNTVYNVTVVADEPEYDQEIQVAVGETVIVTDETGNYVDDVDRTDLDESIATVTVTPKETVVHTLSDAVTALESGKQYVLYNTAAQKLMNSERANTYDGTAGLALSSTLTNFQDKDFWTITAVEGGYYVQDMNGKYLTVASGSAGVTETAVVISLAYDSSDWTIGENGQYLNDFGGFHSVVAGWSDIDDTNSQWYIYEVISTLETNSTDIAVTGVAEGVTYVTVGETTYKITVIAHTCVFDQEVATEQYLASEATCTAPATYYYSCACGEKGTETFEHGEALGHDYVDGVCDRCGEEDPDYVAPKADEVVRLAGSHRWNTALKVADEMKANLDVEKFDAIIIASGNGFADALAGSYLSTVKSAPILLSWGNGGKFEYLDTDNIDYIKANLAEDGVVYLLGGTSAVPELYETELSDYEVKRLGGKDRFETNLMILEEAGVAAGSEILVCTSTNFADSLSASAAGLPILLVFNESGKLYGDQPEYLAGLENCTFTVIGGESAVSEDLAAAIGEYGDVERLAGANRFDTSVLVAEKYFEAPETAVLAYAWNYPDGLCGGALAYSMNAPLVLTMTNYEAQAVAYAESVGLTTGIVLGGESLISDAAVRAIFAMDAAAEIVVK